MPQGRWRWAGLIGADSANCAQPHPTLGVEPIVDLVHYGLPPWIDAAYLNPDFPERMAEYAGRLAERCRLPWVLGGERAKNFFEALLHFVIRDL